MVGQVVDATVVQEQLAAALAEAETRIRAGRFGSVEDLRARFPAVWESPDAVLELIYAEYVFRRNNGEAPDRADWHRRYPNWSDRLDRVFGLDDLVAGVETHNENQVGTIPGGGSRSAEPDFDHPTGYEVLAEIGRGGTAVVYKARQVALNRVVAVKVLRGGWFREEDSARIRREAEAVARLQHPHIVQIHEVGEWEGEPFLALEYVPGGTLADALARRHRQGTVGIQASVAATLVRTLAQAIHHAHEQGIVHRDLKPSNVLLADDTAGLFANPKIADFGLAVTTDMDSSVSQSAALVGTPCFMAPEQANGRRAAVGPRTDVYALGGILYELLTGRPPHQGTTVLETLDLVRHTDPVRPRLLCPQLQRDLETICLKCLEKDPVRRYTTAGTLADDLARFLDGRPITARPVGVVESGWKWCRRRPLLAGLVATILLLVGSLFAITQAKLHSSESARQRETELRTELEATRAKELIASARAHWNNNDLAEGKRLLDLCPEDRRDADWQKLFATTRAELTSFPVPNTATGPGLTLSRSGRLAVINGFRSGTILDTDTGAVIGQVSSASPLGVHFFFSDDEQTLLALPTKNHLALSGTVASRFDRVAAANADRFSVLEFDLTARTERRVRNSRHQPQAVSSRQGLLAAPTGTATLTVTDVWTNRTVATIDLSAAGACEGLCFDPAGRHLVCVHPTRVIIRDTTTWKVVHDRPFQKADRASGYAIHPDLNTLYYRLNEPTDDGVRAEDQRWGIVALDLARNRESFRTFDDPVHSFRVSPDGTLLVVGDALVLHLLDARTGVRRTTFRGHTRGTPQFDFGAEGRLVSVSSDGQLKTWDTGAWLK